MFIRSGQRVRIFFRGRPAYLKLEHLHKPPVLPGILRILDLLGLR